MRKRFGFSEFTRLSVIAVALIGWPALAQSQAPTAPAAQTASTGWLKVCDQDKKTKKNVCAMSLQIKDAKERPLATVRIVEVDKAPSKGFSIIVPPGLLLQPGLRVQVDSSKQNAVPFQICFPAACIAEARVDNNFIGGLKRGNEMKIIGLNQQGKPVEFKATLSGFTAIYDGEGIAPEEAAAANETLQQKLQRRAEEARKRLLDKQGEQKQ